jgi:hypothetical protein
LGRLFAVLLAVGMLTGCDWLQNRFKTCRDIRVDLVNSEQTLGPVHVTGPSEGFSQETLLASGATRQISMCVERGDSEKFRAATETFQVLGVGNCVVGQSLYNYEAITPRVTWTLYGFLCEGW